MPEAASHIATRGCLPVSSTPAFAIPNTLTEEEPSTRTQSTLPNPNAPVFTPVGSHFVCSNLATQLKSNTLMMTCRVLVSTPDGLSVEARALLDCASSASFISGRLAQTLRLPRHSQSASITGMAGLTHHSSSQSVTSFNIFSLKALITKLGETAIIVPKAEWKHLVDLDLADPDFGHPCKIDLLLRVDIFVDVMLHGRWRGPPGTPVAFETLFGWVLAGSTQSFSPDVNVTTCHVSCATGNEILRKF